MFAVGMTVTKALFALSGNTCYFDGCEQRLTDPAWTRVMAEIAHICGHRPGSARYDPTLTPDELHGFDNLMLLCRNHHAEVDDLNPDAYPVDDLKAMKQRHESRTERWASDGVLTAYARLALLELRQTLGAPPVDTMTEEEESELFESVRAELKEAERRHLLAPDLELHFYSPWQINEAMHADKKPVYFSMLESHGLLERFVDRDVVDFTFTARGQRFLNYVRAPKGPAT